MLETGSGLHRLVFRVDNLASITDTGGDNVLSKSFTPIQSPAQWTPGALPPGVERPGKENHL